MLTQAGLRVCRNVDGVVANKLKCCHEFSSVFGVVGLAWQEKDRPELSLLLHAQPPVLLLVWRSALNPPKGLLGEGCC
jgi:hypothetical protein